MGSSTSTSEFVDWYVECLLLAKSSPPPFDLKYNKYYMLLIHLLIQVNPAEFTYNHYYYDKNYSNYIQYWKQYLSSCVSYLHYFGRDDEAVFLGPGDNPPWEYVIIAKFYRYSSHIFDLFQEDKTIKYVGWNCTRLVEKINHKLHLINRDDLKFRI